MSVGKKIAEKLRKLADELERAPRKKPTKGKQSQIAPVRRFDKTGKKK